MVNGPSLFRSAWSYVADTLTPVTDWISAASFLSAGQTFASPDSEPSRRRFSPPLFESGSFLPVQLPFMVGFGKRNVDYFNVGVIF